MLAPTVDEIEAEYEGSVVVAKCNVDDADEASMQFPIRNIPTLLFFKGGEMVNRLVGAVSKQEITAILDSLI
jgi:thioredoxin 1